MVGDALCATTHSDLYLRAVEKGIQVKVIHNASIINAVAGTGLSIYDFGRTISVPFFDGKWKPTSFVSKCINNYKQGMHSLMLLDIKTHELDWKAYMRGVERYQNPRYMYCSQAAAEFCEILDFDPQKEVEDDDEISEGTQQAFLDVQKEAKEAGFTTDCECVACMRVGTDSQRFICCSLKKMSQLQDEMGAPLHSLVVLGNSLNEIENKMLDLWRLK